MRSARLVAVAVLSVLILAVPASAYINLLQNSGFETGEEYPWEFGGSECEGGLLGPSDAAHTGAYFAGVQGAECVMGQRIEPLGCAEYLEFYYISAGGAEAEFWVDILYSDGTEQPVAFPHSPNPGALPWGFFHLDLYTTKLVEAVEIEMEDGALNVDDFDLEACPAPAVGGIVIPADNFAIVAPWLAVIGLVGCLTAVIVVAKKRFGS